jgi:predicted SAM-dependent methyltransferase
MRCESYGTDLSKKCIEHARSSGIHVISWDDIPDHRFDFINTEQLLERLAEPLDTLRHLKSAMKEGGIIKISVPTARNIDERLKRMDWKSHRKSSYSLNPVAPMEHINCF